MTQRSVGGETTEADDGLGIPRWVWALVPLVLVGVMLVAMVTTAPAFDRGEPAPELSVSYHTIPDDETIVLHVTNDGSEDLTIAQVFVNGAYWSFDVEKGGGVPFLDGGDGPRTLGATQGASVHIPYHLSLSPDNEVEVTLLLDGGETFTYDIEGVQTTGGVDMDLLTTLGLVGLLVGVIPVAIGMLWYPYMRSMSDRWLYAVLAFAGGVLAYLAIASVVEAADLVGRIPGTYAGEALLALGVLGTFLVVQSISEWRRARTGGQSQGLWIAYLVAVGIGLHNLAEGLAIGGAYALGQLSLAAFLILGFMLHNVTEGPAVVAPLARADRERPGRPAWYHFVALGLIAGGPVILGGWIGGISLSPTVGALFLAIGAGAILQVIWELVGLVRAGGGRATSALNLWAFLVGAVVMYATGLFVPL